MYLLGLSVMFEKKEIIVVDKVKRKSKGQSIVEFTILLPLLLMLLSSLIEFGFALNEYLDLIDTTRETARWLSDVDPIDQSDGSDDITNFYLKGVDELDTTLDRAGWISLDPTVDDVVISVFSINNKTVVARLPDPITNDGRCASAPPNGGDLGWRRNCKKPSAFSSFDIEGRIDSLTSAPNTGVVLVEIFYDYNMKLGLPWVTGIVGDTITLHAYSFAPNAASEP